MRTRHPLRATFVLAMVVPLLAASCGGDDGTDNPTTPATTSGGGGGNDVSAALEDFAIALDPDTVDAGDVHFEVTNNGPSVHEFVIFNTEFDEDSLPMDGATVDENDAGIEVVDELEDLDADTTTDLDVPLDAGSYVIICNVEGHYQSGMHTTLTVA